MICTFHKILFRRSKDADLDGQRMWHEREKKGACRVSVKKPKGETIFDRPRPRWEYIIKIGIQEVGGGHGLG